MEDIFSLCKEGNILQIRNWLDNPENDLLQGDEHGFSPLHWACREGRANVVDILLLRGAQVNSTNMGDDTPLHLAASQGHTEIVKKLLTHRADANAANEHGNTALHYACFWGHVNTALELVEKGGSHVTQANRYGATPLDVAKVFSHLVAASVAEKAEACGQDLTRTIPYKNQSWWGTKKRSRDATLSRCSGIDMEQLTLESRISSGHSHDLWKGKWQNTDIVARILSVRDISSRVSRDFQEQYPRLRVFSHPNVLPVLGCCNSPPNLIVISEFRTYGSLFHALHSFQKTGRGLVIDSTQGLQIALDVARGMSFLHTLNPLIPRFYLSTKYIMLDENSNAQINMADAKFSFQDKGRLYNVNWMAPEVLKKKHETLNVRSADMWSFGVILWELDTRQIPFDNLSNMQIGMKVCLDDVRLSVDGMLSPHLSKLARIAMNEIPAKRPTFDMVLPIMERILDNNVN